MRGAALEKGLDMILNHKRRYLKRMKTPLTLPEASQSVVVTTYTVTQDRRHIRQHSSRPERLPQAPPGRPARPAPLPPASAEKAFTLASNVGLLGETFVATEAFRANSVQLELSIARLHVQGVPGRRASRSSGLPLFPSDSLQCCLPWCHLAIAGREWLDPNLLLTVV